MKKFFDRETNPAVYIRVMPVYPDRPLPVAVFVRYAGFSNWEKYSKEYQRPSYARMAAKMLEMQHFAWKYEKEEDVK